MDNSTKTQLKMRQQIFNLKEILSNANEESLKLKSDINEFQTFFKLTKKIIKEKINLIEKSKVEKNNSCVNDLKKDICNELNEIINKYKNTKSIYINKKKEKILKEIKEKNNEIRKILTKIKYNELKNEKDILIQNIQEKNNICRFFNSSLEYDNNIAYLFQPKSINYLDSLYEIKLDNFHKNKEYQQTINNRKKYIMNNQKNFLEVAEEGMNDLKEVCEKRKKEINNFIIEKGFNCEFENNKYKERYHLEIDLIEKYNNSSDSDSNTDSDYENNIEKSDILKNKNIKNNLFNKEKYCKYQKIQKSTMSLSDKETNDQEISSNNNTNLINKLVILKEQYNKLINEKYDLENEKIFKEKKINEIRIKLNNMRNKRNNICMISQKTNGFEYQNNNNNYIIKS